MHIAHLGRVKHLAVAELEARLSAHELKHYSPNTVVIAADLPIASLGGTIRIGEVINKRLGDWFDVAITEIEKDIRANNPTGKLHIGLSVIDAPVPLKSIHAALLGLKKRLKADGFSVRVILGKQPILNAAEVLRNQLHQPGNAEYLYVGGDGDSLLAKTVGIQDVDAYSARDFDRPARDAYVGMLPPKLAQIMINLALGQLESWKLEDGSWEDLQAQSSSLQSPTILDPFCGTGVILQEALLMGCNAYGTDLEPRMIEYSQTNITWLLEKFPSSNLQALSSKLEVGDATTHTWSHPFDAVVSETYLGRPLSQQPTPPELAELQYEIKTLLRTFLKNLASQSTPGTPVVLAIPAWRQGKRFVSALTVDDYRLLGYTDADFTHVASDDLLYYRSDQIVARKLLVLRRNNDNVKG